MDNEYYLKIEAEIDIDSAYVTINANKEGLKNLKEVIENLLSKSIKNFSGENVLMLEELGGLGLTRDTPFKDCLLVKILKICIKEACINNEGYYLKIDARTDIDGAYVNINANQAGLENLSKLTDSLLNRSTQYLPADIMLMTEEFGGYGLTKDVPDKDHVLVNILKIYRWE